MVVEKRTRYHSFHVCILLITFIVIYYCYHFVLNKDISPVNLRQIKLRYLTNSLELHHYR